MNRSPLVLDFKNQSYMITSNGISTKYDEFISYYPPYEIDNKETKTVVEKSPYHFVRVNNYNNGILKNSFDLMPEIEDISLYENTLVMTFVDKTKETAKLHEDDEFNIERAISTCMMKKILSENFFCNGSAVYNKLVEMGMKFWNNKLEEEYKREEEKALEEERRNKRIEKQRKRKERAAERYRKEQEEERERQIEIQKEAYIRAMKELDLEN